MYNDHNTYVIFMSDLYYYTLKSIFGRRSGSKKLFIVYTFKLLFLQAKTQ